MPELSVQLYSVRDAVAADLEGSLARLAAIGLTHVEPFDLSDPTRLRAALDAGGLDAPSAHARLDEDLDRTLEAAGYGIDVAYHNHHWESGDSLERFADRSGVALELDTYWAAVGGEDVPALLGRLGDRVRLLHLKDGPVDTDAERQLPLGQGAMPVPAILAAATAAELGVLEFDAYAGDLFEGIAAGFEYARGL
jgi:sugar phosphate isomerase/epimerase